MIRVIGILLSIFGFMAGAGSAQTLFTMEHNKNANVVVYEAWMSGGAIDESEPVRAYWLMRAEHGQREELSIFEKAMAYGWDIESVPSHNAYKMSLTAFPNRPIIIQSSAGIPFATMLIGGKRAYLKRVYIYADESKVVPEVRYVDVFGETLDDHKSISERITK